MPKNTSEESEMANTAPIAGGVRTRTAMVLLAQSSLLLISTHAFQLSTEISWLGPPCSCFIARFKCWPPLVPHHRATYLLGSCCLLQHAVQLRDDLRLTGTWRRAEHHLVQHLRRLHLDSPVVPPAPEAAPKRVSRCGSLITKGSNSKAVNKSQQLKPPQ